MENGKIITNFSETEKTEEINRNPHLIIEAEKYYQLTSEIDFPNIVFKL